jgi:hypothetical protein
MSDETVKIISFNKEYILPRNILNKSHLLSRIFGGQYQTVDTIDLELDPYSRLLSIFIRD